MDPFTAVSLVGNSLQFITFAKNIYKQAREIRASVTGLPKKREELLRSTSQLTGILQCLRAGYNQARETTASPTQERLLSLLQKCLRLANELEMDIQKMVVKNRSNILFTVKGVVRGMWKTSELEEKVNELNSIQEMLFRTLLVHISNQQDSLLTTLEELREKNRQLEANRSQDLKDLSSEMQTTVASIEASIRPVDPLALSPQQLHEISSNLLGWPDRVQSFQREQQIIGSLFFEGMFNRRDNIVEAHEQTCRWIYDPRLHFTQWLESNEGVYWVAGDPGSGKSTLLKHLSTDHQVDLALQRWAAPMKLVKASFYFWYTGTGIQKSQEGLLRSLLFEILRQCPSAIPPKLAQERHMNPLLAHHWSRLDLMKALQDLNLQSPNIKFCFFIDGLDEYGGTFDVARGFGHDECVAEHVVEIIDTIDKLSKLQNIKLCLSSRVWHAFEQKFGRHSHQKLYVHEHNREDIRLYVENRFKKSEVFTASQLHSADLEQLVVDIVRYSRGVFLWVSLVVESLLRGLGNHDRLAELRSRLETTPRTLHGFFERMLSSVEEVYQEQAAQILLVALHADNPLPAIMYSFIGDDQHDALTAGIRAWGADECKSKANLAEVRLRVRCPDLLKITNPQSEGSNATSVQTMISDGKARVEFLHRSVRDFLALEYTQGLLASRMRRRPFNHINYICRAILSLIKSAIVAPDSEYGHAPCHPDPHEEYLQSIVSLLLSIRHYALESELQFGVAQSEVLDELERTIVRQTSNPKFLIRQDSFLGFMAVEGGLHLYVEARLKRYRFLQESSTLFSPAALSQTHQLFPRHGICLLERALFPRSSRLEGVLFPKSYRHGDGYVSPSMVSLLLDCGVELKPGVWGLFIEMTYLLNPVHPTATAAGGNISDNEAEGPKEGPESTHVPTVPANSAATMEAHLQIIKELLERGADPWRQCTVSNPLPVAARTGPRRETRRRGTINNASPMMDKGGHKASWREVERMSPKKSDMRIDLLEVVKAARRYYRHRPGGELVSYIEALIERKRMEWGPPRGPDDIADLEPYASTTFPRRL